MKYEKVSSQLNRAPSGTPYQKKKKKNFGIFVSSQLNRAPSGTPLREYKLSYLKDKSLKSVKPCPIRDTPAIIGLSQTYCNIPKPASPLFTAFPAKV